MNFARASAPWKVFCFLLKFLLKNCYKCRVGSKKSESRGVGWLIEPRSGSAKVRSKRMTSAVPLGQWAISINRLGREKNSIFGSIARAQRGSPKWTASALLCLLPLSWWMSAVGYRGGVAPPCLRTAAGLESRCRGEGGGGLDRLRAILGPYCLPKRTLGSHVSAQFVLGAQHGVALSASEDAN